MARMLTNAQAATFVGLPKSTLDRWRQNNKGPRYGKLGRRIFYREEDLEAWVEAQFAGTDGPSAA